MIDFLWEVKYWLILICWLGVILLFLQQHLLRHLRELLRGLCLFVEREKKQELPQEEEREKLLEELDQRLEELKGKKLHTAHLDTKDIEKLLSQLKVGKE